MIIDCHCHAGKGDGLTGPWDTNAPLEKYLLRAARSGIDRTVLFAAFHSDYMSANREVARIVKSRQDRFYGFAFVHPRRDRGRIRAMVEEAVLRFGFVGIKVHRHDAAITREVCESARVFSLPVIYDVVGEVSVLELLAEEYPDVTFIIPHLGSFSDDWRAQFQGDLNLSILAAPRIGFSSNLAGFRRMGTLIFTSSRRTTNLSGKSSPISQAVPSVGVTIKST